MRKEEIRRPDAAAMERLLAEQASTTVGLILRFAWRHGLAREEIRCLTWEAVDFSGHRLCLPDRAVPLEGETETCLERRYGRLREGLPPYVILSDRRHSQLRPESLSRLVRVALDQAGITGISLMDLRHDFIIRQLETHEWPYVVRISGIAVATLHACFSEYLSQVREAPAPQPEVDSFLLWKVLQAEGGSPVGLALWMSWKLGMQVQEIVGLTWDQVDLNRGVLRLPDREAELGVTLRRLLRTARSHRGPEEDPHVILTPNSRRPLDQPRLSKMVRTALIRGGIENVSLGDLCREERREGEEARLMAYAAENGTISRREAMRLLELSKVAAYERLRQLADRGKLVRVGGKYYPAGQVVPPEEQYEAICAFLAQSGPAYRKDLADLLRIGGRQCGLILRHMVEDGRLIQAGQRYYLPMPRKATP